MKTVFALAALLASGYGLHIATTPTVPTAAEIAATNAHLRLLYIECEQAHPGLTDGQCASTAITDTRQVFAIFPTAKETESAEPALVATIKAQTARTRACLANIQECR